jgi:hypothetical protein
MLEFVQPVCIFFASSLNQHRQLAIYGILKDRTGQAWSVFTKGGYRINESNSGKNRQS